MKIDKAKIETITKNPPGRYESAEPTYHVKLEIQIPGGMATYEIPSSKEINSSIERAENLK